MSDVTDTALELRSAADLIRARAKSAANDSAGDELCCWDFERLGGHERVIEVRQHTGGTDQGIIAVPATSGVAGHVALWDPTNVVAVAELLETIADPAYQVHPMVYLPALALAELLGDGRDHGDET
jgi:hypothetical protein